ncbi:hypothetical protein PMAYCL1PPCAC_10407, partial [Pristionchus mayeri]
MMKVFSVTLSSMYLCSVTTMHSIPRETKKRTSERRWTASSFRSSLLVRDLYPCSTFGPSMMTSRETAPGSVVARNESSTSWLPIMKHLPPTYSSPQWSDSPRCPHNFCRTPQGALIQRILEARVNVVLVCLEGSSLQWVDLLTGNNVVSEIFSIVVELVRHIAGVGLRRLVRIPPDFIFYVAAALTRHSE